MIGLAGAVVWAVVPFAPAAPFRLYAGTDHEPVALEDAGRLVTAAQAGRDAQFTFLVPGRVRPVLIVSDSHDADLGEYLALRLVRFSKLEPSDQERIRRGDSATHVHLPPEQFTGLPEENAAMIAGLVRVHRSAVATPALGRLDPDRLALVHERLVRHHGFDLSALVRDELRRLIVERRRGN